MWWLGIRVGAKVTWYGAKWGWRAAKGGWWMVKRNVRTYTTIPRNATDWTWVLIEATPWYLFYRKHKDTFNTLMAQGHYNTWGLETEVFRR